MDVEGFEADEVRDSVGYKRSKCQAASWAGARGRRRRREEVAKSHTKRVPAWKGAREMRQFLRFFFGSQHLSAAHGVDGVIRSRRPCPSLLPLLFFGYPASPRFALKR
jgi:hypothetical protein